MCGICGIYSHTLSVTEGKAFQELLMLNQMRGMDSTGVFAVSTAPNRVQKFVNKGNTLPVFFHKEIYDATYYLSTDDKNKTKQKLLDVSGKQAFVGHCRSATIGDVSDKNAHPFDFENVIGVHNGTIRKDFKYSKDFETDSESLYALINDVGIEEALNEVESTSTSYALAFFDKKNSTLNLVRNSDRPLHYGYSYSGRTLVFSSEKRHLQFLSSTETKSITVQAEPPIGLLKPGVLLSINLLADKPEEFYQTRELKIRKSTYNYQYYHNGKWVDRSLIDDDLPWKDCKVVTPSTSVKALTTTHKSHKIEPSTKTKAQTSFATDMVPGYNGIMMPKSEFEEVLMDGCLLCNTPHEYEEGMEYKVGWHAADKYICPTCLESNSDWVPKFIAPWKNAKK